MNAAPMRITVACLDTIAGLMPLLGVREVVPP